ncbi:MAG: PSD1 and planctomycete cytochrome C domain-containing protein [Pirellulales bacterium]
MPGIAIALLGAGRGLAEEPLPGAAPAAGAIRFNRDILPILSDTCFACHGPDENKRESDLRLDNHEGALADLGGRAGIVPGKPDESEVFLRITEADPSMRMPPAESGKTLSEHQIERIRRWIEEGADWQEHWSYTPLERPELPAVSDESLVANPIDRFVLARLDELGMRPSASADRVTLVRRLYFDLVGLPPTPEQVSAFVNDPTPDAYERLADSLLASPHYGERMAMYWLDLVRYADTTGIHGDNHRDVAPYRDYVIAAFNENKPFDRFAVEQLAGDLLPEATLAQKVASGYNRMNMTTAEGGAQAKEYIAKYAADRVRNASTVWLGVTLGCAECHDHKFDPFLTRDFYSFAAFFADVQEQAVALPGPPVPVPAPHQAAELKQLDDELAALKNTLNTQTPELDSAQAAWEAGALEKTGRLPTLAAWHAVGPFMAGSLDEAFDTAYEPEGKVDLAQTYREGKLKWTPQPDWADGQIHKLSGNNAATYLYRTVLASRPMQAELSLGSDDSLKVWLNGQEMFARRVARAAAPDQEKVVVNLVEGDNRLLIKVVNGGGESAFYFGTEQSGLPIDVARNLGTPVDKRSEEQAAQLASYHRGIAPLLDPVRAQVAELEKSRAALDALIPRTLVSMSVEPRVVRILPRGNWLDESGEIVTPAVPAFLKPLEVEGRRANRLDLAGWLVSRDNPLTARGFVNRLWKLAFGRGLAMPLDDLGAQGTWPTHLELLDWLAAEFADGGWDVKQMVKLIVMSNTYRQTSAASAEVRQRDPYNLYLARQSRFRLDAEQVRDNALAISGLLVPAVGGPSVKPYQPAGYWGHLNFPVREYEPGHGAQLYRRGLYTYWCRTFLHPSLLAFDAPSREECTADRNRSNTPLQALVLLNDPTYVEAARVFAEQIVRAGGSSTADRVAWAVRRALAREPRPEELAVLERLYQEHQLQYAADRAAAEKLVDVGEWPVPKDLDASELAAWTSVARAILNLHETITRY